MQPDKQERLLVKRAICSHSREVDGYKSQLESNIFGDVESSRGASLLFLPRNSAISLLDVEVNITATSVRLPKICFQFPGGLRKRFPANACSQQKTFKMVLPIFFSKNLEFFSQELVQL